MEPLRGQTFHDALGKVVSWYFRPKTPPSSEALPHLQWPMLLTPCEPTSPKTHHLPSHRTGKPGSIHWHLLPPSSSPIWPVHKPNGSWHLTNDHQGKKFCLLSVSYCSLNSYLSMPLTFPLTYAQQVWTLKTHSSSVPATWMTRLTLLVLGMAFIKPLSIYLKAIAIVLPLLMVP